MEPARTVYFRRPVASMPASGRRFVNDLFSSEAAAAARVRRCSDVPVGRRRRVVAADFSRSKSVDVRRTAAAAAELMPFVINEESQRTADPTNRKPRAVDHTRLTRAESRSVRPPTSRQRRRAAPDGSSIRAKD